jgi:hypothetical protein
VALPKVARVTFTLPPMDDLETDWAEPQDATPAWPGSSGGR